MLVGSHMVLRHFQYNPKHPHFIGHLHIMYHPTHPKHLVLPTLASLYHPRGGATASREMMGFFAEVSKQIQ